MRYEDISQDMILRHDPSAASCRVIARSARAFAIQWDEDNTVVALAPDSAEFFERTTRRDPLRDHPAVLNHGQGVSNEDLASFVESLTSLSTSRIKGIGADQYGQGKLQKFEEMSVDELVTGLMEEAADAVNYIAMSAIKFLSAVAAVKAASQ